MSFRHQLAGSKIGSSHLRSASGPNNDEGHPNSVVDGSSPMGHHHRIWTHFPSSYLSWSWWWPGRLWFFGYRTQSPRGIATGKDWGNCSGSGEVDSATRNAYTLSVLSLRPVIDLHTSTAQHVYRRMTPPRRRKLGHTTGRRTRHPRPHSLSRHLSRHVWVEIPTANRADGRGRIIECGSDDVQWARFSCFSRRCIAVRQCRMARRRIRRRDRMRHGKK